MTRDIETLDLDSDDAPLEYQRVMISRRALATIAIAVIGIAWLASGVQGAALVLWAEVVIGLTAALQ